jgi:hypothetical protein
LHTQKCYDAQQEATQKSYGKFSETSTAAALDRGLIATKTKLIPISETASIQFTDTNC